MFSHFLKVALRHLRRHKLTTFINLLGLATGIASCLLIFLFIRDESSYDRHFSKSDRIYRLARERQYPNRLVSYAQVGHSWGPTLQDELPEVEAFCRMFTFQGVTRLYIKIGETVFEEEKVTNVDSTFFELFDVEMISGDPKTALTAPDGVVLTESTAAKYFGATNAIGQTITVRYSGGEDAYVVKGVCRDFPEQTHFDYDLLFSAEELGFLTKRPMYIRHNTYTYFLFRDGSAPEAVAQKLAALTDKYSGPEVEEAYGVGYDDYKKLGNRYGYFLQPLTDIHLHSNLEEEQQPNGSAQLLNFLTLIAIFILLIACVNYMNLAIARAGERAREIGLRRTVGSSRGAIIRQFLAESLLITLLSTLIGLLLAAVFLPLFNHLTDKGLSVQYLFNPNFLLLLIGLAVIMGLLAGSYPAVVLSAFRPVKVLRGRLTAPGGTRWLGNSLIVFQYVTAVVLIICTIVVYAQQAYVMNTSLGFDKDRLLLLEARALSPEKKQTFEEELRKIDQVQCLGRASTRIGGRFFGASVSYAGMDQPLIANGFIAADHFLECLGVDIILGRDFSPEFNDSSSVIINETAMQELGLSEPIGQRLQLGTTDADQGLEVIGVAANFHYQSLYNPAKPLVIEYDRGGYQGSFIIRLAPGTAPEAIEKIEKVWDSFLPGYPFQYSFMDQEWAALHRRGQVSRGVFAWFALLAILITGIGLFGLVRYMAQRRAKEIGIRKVFGASVNNLMQLFSRHFLKLAAIALIVALPLAWYFANRWLQGFAYRINLEWWLFALGGLTAVLITILSVGYESYKAASANPVEVIRTE